MSAGELSIGIAETVSELDPAQWDRLAGNSVSPGSGNLTADPFTSHAFLSLLEASHSVGPGTGWSSAPLTITDEDGALRGVMPSYIKDHSQGEYVFDQGWADAWERAGGSYYPKLQIAVPFTPVAGPRLLTNDAEMPELLLKGAQALVEQNGLSSAHATFIEPTQLPFFEQQGWLTRSDIQFHWFNQDYADFDDFLAALSSRKRKAVRKERANARQGLTIKRLTGDDITEREWDAFWVFYQDTGARKWGYPYLTREAFSLMSERMADQIVLVMAYDGDRPIAAALNFLGKDALFGRYWGCCEQRPFLHFEICYYQAIELAIERKLSRVEAGAQGGHKIARGYEPVRTWSAHWIADPNFRRAVAEFLERERQGIAVDQLWLSRHLPYKKG